MLSFAIRSEEEDAEKVDADGHSDSSSEDELVKLEVRPTRQFPRQRTEPQEPTRNNSFTPIGGGGGVKKVSGYRTWICPRPT